MSRKGIKGLLKVQGHALRNRNPASKIGYHAGFIIEAISQSQGYGVGGRSVVGQKFAMLTGVDGSCCRSRRIELKELVGLVWVSAVGRGETRRWGHGSSCPLLRIWGFRVVGKKDRSTQKHDRNNRRLFRVQALGNGEYSPSCNK